MYKSIDKKSEGNDKTSGGSSKSDIMLNQSKLYWAVQAKYLKTWRQHLGWRLRWYAVYSLMQ